MRVSSLLLLLSGLMVSLLACENYPMPQFNNPVDPAYVPPSAPLTTVPVSRNTFLPEGFVFNYGRYGGLQVGSTPGVDEARHYVLLGFELPESLDGKSVVSAQLELTVRGFVTEGEDDPVSVPIYVYEVLVEWDEGTGAATETYDGATWFYRRFSVPGDPSSGIPWAGEGCSAEGIDYDGTVLTSGVIDSVARYTLDLPPATVQRWVDQPDSFRGLLVTDHDAFLWRVDFFSRHDSGGAPASLLVRAE
jgi:hypothetical protein